MLETALYIALGVLVGVVAALKVIAPKTKTTKDDKALGLLGSALAAVKRLVGLSGPDVGEAEAPKPAETKAATKAKKK